MRATSRALRVTDALGVAEVDLTSASTGALLGTGRVTCAVDEDEDYVDDGEEHESAAYAVRDLGELVLAVGRSRYAGFALSAAPPGGSYLNGSGGNSTAPRRGGAARSLVSGDFEAFVPGVVAALGASAVASLLARRSLIAAHLMAFP